MDEEFDDRSSSAISAEVCRAVGARVRELRTDMGLTMAKFADAADISLGMLSKIEHAQTAPSLATLVRLSSAAGVPVTALFRGLDEEHDIVIVRADERHEIIHEGSSPTRIYEDLGSLRGPNRTIEAMTTTLTTDDAEFPLFQHAGVEFLHVLEGSMEYGYGANSYKIGPGDTMQIHGEVSHGPRAVLETPVRFLSVKVYPTNLPTD
ncbi:MAG: helix-turn-helix domain-containing protein [Acidimicrobiales bacterium]